MKNKIAKIGYLIFCFIVAILIITHQLTVIEGSGIFVAGLLVFGVIRRKKYDILPENKK